MLRVSASYFIFLGTSILAEAQANSWFPNLGNPPSVQFAVSVAEEHPGTGLKSMNKNGVELFVEELPSISNSDVQRARVVQAKWDKRTNYTVEVELSVAGGEKLSRLTAERTGKRIAILIENSVFGAPFVEQKLSDRLLSLSGFHDAEKAERIAQGIVGNSK